MNLEIVLCQNVGYMRWLFARALGCRADARQVEFVRELCQALEVRLQAVEEVVHPVLKANGWGTGLDQAASQHASMRRLLAELAAGTEGVGFNAAQLYDASLRMDKVLAAQGRLVAAASAALLVPAKRASLNSEVRRRLGHVGACAPRSAHAQLRRECPARAGLVARCPARCA